MDSWHRQSKEGYFNEINKIIKCASIHENREKFAISLLNSILEYKTTDEWQLRGLIGDIKEELE
jgi:hypothetical protein